MSLAEIKTAIEQLALARREGELAVWFWIGTHEEYNSFVRQLRYVVARRARQLTRRPRLLRLNRCGPFWS